MHIVSSAGIHRGQREHAVLDAIDHKAFMVMESMEQTHNKPLEVKFHIIRRSSIWPIQL